jgi:hypothetical protein
VCVIAIHDHSRKHDERVAARRSAWLCAHRGTQCGGRDPAAIEAAWNRRERLYFGACGLLVVIAVAGAAATIRRS